MDKQPSEARAALDLVRAEHEGAAGLARRQASRFSSLVDHARVNSPFYKRLYAGLPGGGIRLGDLPPVTKPQLMAAFDEWVTDPAITLAGIEEFTAQPELAGTPYLGDYFVCTSSGTTGHPGMFVYDQGAIAVYRAIAVARIDRTWLSARGWVELARRRLRWALVAGTGGHYGGVGWIELERRRSGWRNRGYRTFSVQRPFAELVSELDAFDPAILTSYPSALELLAEEQAAGRLQLHPTIIETAGESMLPDARARAAEAFGCTIHDAYAASEFQCLAFDCAEGWLHVNSDWAILEPVGADYSPTPPGEPSHTVLLTNLANRVQPLIRYDLGDSVLASPEPCPCGNPLPAIRVWGRRDDVLHFSAGRGRSVAILPLAIGSVVEETPGVHRCQLVQTGPMTLSIRLEPRPDADPDAVWSELSARLAAYLGDQGIRAVRIKRASEPPEPSGSSGKFRQVIGTPPVTGR